MTRFTLSLVTTRTIGINGTDNSLHILYCTTILSEFSSAKHAALYCKEINCHSFHVHQCKECCGNHQPQTICVLLGTVDLPASAYPELRSRREVDSSSIAACRVTGSLLSLLIPRTDRFFRRKDRSRVRLRLFSRNDEGYKLDSSQAEVDLSGCKEHGHKHDTGSSLDYSDAKNVLGKTTLNCQQHDAAPGLQVNAFSESF